jgi:hypothetical protein
VDNSRARGSVADEVEVCETCAVKARVRTPAVTCDEDGKPVCFTHAPDTYKDELTITAEMTRFITWHEEQAARCDGTIAVTEKPLSKAKNRALAMAHRRAAEALRTALRKRSK